MAWLLVLPVLLVLGLVTLAVFTVGVVALLLAPRLLGSGRTHDRAQTSEGSHDTVTLERDHYRRMS